MKTLRLFGILLIVFACLTAGLVYAQETATDEPAAVDPADAVGPVPAQALVPCDENTGETAVCDLLATSAEDIVGVWSLYFNAAPAVIRYNEDGTWWIADSIENSAEASAALPSGTFSFDENGVFTSTDPLTPVEVMPEECRAAAYVLRVIKVGDQPVALNHAVRHDCFAPRRTDWAYTMLWVGEE